MNVILDNFMEMFHRRDYSQNPMLSQYNTIKVTLLIYRLNWKIRNKKLYNLMTKSMILDKYLTTSLKKYLDK